MAKLDRYDPKQIEPKWQEIWKKTGIYKTPDHPGEDHYYCLVMFPYPSGDLHTGHWYNFGPADTHARFKRMQGHKLLHPIGFDAFGLPAENAAIKRNIPPSDWTDQNAATMTTQLERLGAMYDWDRVINTSKPDYYRWTQWLFLKLYEKGLAYRAKGWQNWCPKDQTVLANEQVVGAGNVCDRCGTPVVKKELEQWFFKITDYADRLLYDLDKVEWPQRVKTMQQNWIGRSEGALVKFLAVEDNLEVEVFTTRPDTLGGATFVVISPELAQKWAEADWKAPKKVTDYITQSFRETELERVDEKREKTGVDSAVKVVNPLTGEEVPVWVADYVLGGYGTGAIMAVPAHDERDYEFAKKFGLPIKQVVEPQYFQTTEPGKIRDGEPFDHRDAIIAMVKHWKDDKYIALKWKQVAWGTFVTGGIEDGQTAETAAQAEIREETGYLNAKLVKSFGTVHGLFYHVPKKTNRAAHAQMLLMQLTDGGREETSVEEQAIHEVKWLTPKELAEFLTPDTHKHSLRLLNGEEVVFTGEGPLVNSGEFDGLAGTDAKHAIIEHLYKAGRGKGHTQYRLRDWLVSRQRYWGPPIPVVYCQDCGVVPVPKDQLPVVLPLDVEFEPTGKSPLASRPDFYETTCPKCGKSAKRETDTLDTFVDSSWYFLRYPNTRYEKGPFDPEAIKEWMPVDQYIGGVEHAILHLLYSRFITKVLYDEELVGFEEPFKRLFNQGIILGPDGQKMSKSRGNVVNPDDWVDKYGADTFRIYLMFMGPYDQGGPFDTKGISGVHRFLQRVWALVGDHAKADTAAASPELEAALATATHRTIQKVTQDIQNFGFNTSVAAMMEYVNELYLLKAKLPLGSDAWGEALGVLIRLLAPFAPHIAEELWQELGGETSVHLSEWPIYLENQVRVELVDIVVQVNGKLRATLTLPPEIGDEELEALAREDGNVQRQLEGKTVAKTIVVPRKLINFVVR